MNFSLNSIEWNGIGVEFDKYSVLGRRFVFQKKFKASTSLNHSILVFWITKDIPMHVKIEWSYVFFKEILNYRTLKHSVTFSSLYNNTFP